jgi:hypothetical protein
MISRRDFPRIVGLVTGKYPHRVLDGIGHNVPQEARRQFADAIIEVAGY